MEYTDLTDGEVLDATWKLLTEENATAEEVIAYLRKTGF
jgi:hypothetical protein